MSVLLCMTMYFMTMHFMTMYFMTTYFMTMYSAVMISSVSLCQEIFSETGVVCQLLSREAGFVYEQVDRKTRVSTHHSKRLMLSIKEVNPELCVVSP